MNLEGLLRRAVRPRPYYPFSEPRWRGGYPFGAAKRDTFRISNSLSLFNSIILNKLSSPSPRQTLKIYQDRRLWHPDGVNRPMVSRTETRPNVLDIPPDFERVERIWKRAFARDARINKAQERHIAAGRIGWENPENMIICLERKMRKEVLHAFGIAGKSHRAKIHNWNAYSRVRCW